MKWFDISFTDDDGNEYLESISAVNGEDARRQVDILYAGLRGSGKIVQLSDNSVEYAGEPVPFRLGKGEYDSDAS